MLHQRHLVERVDTKVQLSWYEVYFKIVRMGPSFLGRVALLETYDFT